MAALARRHAWWLVFAVVAVAVVLTHLLALDSAPPGLYSDEASIGYNAWAVAHAGIDEHGVRFPLYFEAFGEYKNPVYIYMLMPLTRLLTLTPAVERFPAAICSLGVIAAAGATAWHLSRSRPVLLATLITASVTPWLAVQGRVGFEVPSMLLALSLVLYFLVRLLDGGGAGWGVATGIAVGVALYGYSTGRLYAAMLAAVLLLVLLPRRRHRELLAVMLPIAVAYLVLGIWTLGHPGAITARFDVLSITEDNPPILVAVRRFVENYVTYLGAPFLATHGDANPRQNTEFGGMLLICTLPAITVGFASCLRHHREPLHRFLLGGLAFAPVPAALTAQGTPHALRSSAMLPFLLVLAGLGWVVLLPVLLDRRVRIAAAVLAVAAAGEVVAFEHDLFGEWAGRSYGAFDTGELQAIDRAHAIAGGHTVHLSDTLDQPYIQALFGLTPDPHAYVRQGMASVGMEVDDPGTMGNAPSGDILVLSPYDSAPQGAQLLFQVTATVTQETVEVDEPTQSSLLLVSVYRR